MRRAAIEQILENYAICEDFNGNTFDLERKNLPKNAREGDVLILKKNSVTVDKEYTAVRRKEIAELQRQIFNK